MTRSLRALESYVQIDHRESPGFDAAMANRLGLGRDGVGSKNFQSSIVHCCMCTAGMLLLPRREHKFKFCMKCSAYMCPRCEGLVAAGAPHVPIAQVLDEAYEAAVRAEQLRATGSTILFP